VDKADQRDFDSHYEYWDKIKGVNGGEMSEYCCDYMEKLEKCSSDIKKKRDVWMEDGATLWPLNYCPFCGEKL